MGGPAPCRLRGRPGARFPRRLRERRGAARVLAGRRARRLGPLYFRARTDGPALRAGCSGPDSARRGGSRRLSLAATRTARGLEDVGRRPPALRADRVVRGGVLGPPLLRDALPAAR